MRLWPRPVVWLLLALAAGVPAPLGAAPVLVRGLVRGEDGRPLAGARVELLPALSNFDGAVALLAGRESPAPAATTEADGTGRFALEAPGPGVWRLVVRAAGFVPMQYFPLAAANPVELPPVALRRDAGSAVEVRDGSGRPASGVWVYGESATPGEWSGIASDGWSVGVRIGRTGADGRLTLPRAAGERLAVSAFPPGSAAAARAEGAEQVALALPPAPAGRLLEVGDGAGRPLPDVAVVAGTPAWPVGTTGRDGRLDLRVPASQAVRLQLFAADGRRLDASLPAAAAGGGPVRLALPPPARIAGRVVTATAAMIAPGATGATASAGGVPVGGALVWPGHDPGRFARTAPAGVYELAAPAGERFWIEADAPGFLPQSATVGEGERQAGKGPTLALVPAAVVSGRVVDAAGAPLAAVAVAAAPRPPTPRPEGFHPDGAAARASTDLQGRFVLPGLQPAGVYELAATKEGFAPGLATIARGEGRPREVRIVLAPARPARGRVVDGAGRPVDGVAVRVSPARPERAPRLRARPAAAVLADRFAAATDAAGRFVLAGVPAPVLDLEAHKPGFAPAEVRGLAVSAGSAGGVGGGPIDLGQLVLRPGGSIEGRVTGPRGEPLPGASLWLRPDPGKPPRRPASSKSWGEPEARTDAAGRFRIADLAPGRKLLLLADAEGYLPAAVPGVEASAGGPAGGPAALSIALERAARVAGRVVDGDGRGVPGASVRLSGRESVAGRVGPSRDVEDLEVESDGRGEFAFEEAAPGAVEVTAEAEGYLPAPPQSIDLTAAGVAAGVRLILVRGAAVAGHIADRRGEPVEGARVRVGPAAATSDAAGDYRLAGAAPGSRRIEVVHPGYDPAARQIEIVAGENLADFVLDGGWPVEGLVEDEEAEGEGPVEGALVLLAAATGREYRAVSGPDGAFAVPKVASGTYQVEASHAGYAPLEPRGVEVKGPVADLRLTLRRGGRIRGHLLGVAPEDLAAARVEAKRAGVSRAGTVDPAGGYEVADLTPGDWQVRAWLGDGTRQAEAGVSLESGEREAVRDLEFAGVALLGRVTHGGDPLAGALVSLTGLDATASRTVTSDRLGAFALRDLRPGRYRISLSHPWEVLTHTEDIELLADREMEFEIATVRVHGRVTSRAGARPLPDVLLYFQRIAGPAATEPVSLLTVGTDAAGEFTVERLEAGWYRLTARKNGYLPAERALEVRAGADADDLDIALDAAEGLDLVVRLASGRVPASAVVRVPAAGGRPAGAELLALSAEGYGRLPTLPAGSWDLLVAAPGGVARQVRAEVPGEPLQVVLAAAGRLALRVPALVESGLAASLTLLGADGRPFVGVDPAGALQQRWTLAGGTGDVEDLPPGAWALRVEATDGQVWTGSAAVAAGETAAVTLP